MLAGTVGIKLLVGYLLNIRDDSHIGALLLAKFTTYQDFHTQLYTCAAEFDFISKETIQMLTITLLLPFAIVAACCVIIKMIKNMCSPSYDQNDHNDIAMVTTLYHNDKIAYLWL